ncbi:MAG: leucine-rich repeat protein [Clostridiales bacterium]|nr:leucine-rich repeat protein [Clostridiales bacterium]
MKNIVNNYVERFRGNHRKSHRMAVILLTLALLVFAVVFWQLRFTGIAMTNETYCGLEEHTHTEDCYEEVLVCGLEESEGHTHTEECYETQTVLVCELEESEGHTHTEECYDEEGNLICGLEESEGHTHTEECYETEEVLVCGLEESEGHTHTEDCYEKQLVCGKEEHTHTIECLTDVTADVETASDWKATLPSLSGEWGDDVVAVAKSQLGYTESTKNFTLADDGVTRQGYTRYGAWAGNEYGDWDAMFASFCLHYAGISTSDFPEGTGANAWAVKLQKSGLYEDASDYIPGAGDLVFFDTNGDGKIDHVGIVTDVNEGSGKLTAIEGDYSANAEAADAVCANSYALSSSSIIGYGNLYAAKEAEDVDDEAADSVNSSDSEAADTEESSGSEAADTGESSDSQEETLIQQTLTLVAEGSTVTLNGLLPEDAAMTAEPVDVEIEGMTALLAFDICIFDADGVEYEPEDDTITVTIESSEITGDSSVYYVPEDGDPEKLDTTEAAEGAVEFEAEHFSTYAVVDDTGSGSSGGGEGDTPTVVASGDCSAAGDGSVTWTVYSDGRLVIDGTGAMCDYAKADEEPWQTYLGKNGDPIVTTLEIGSGITYIGAYAFIGATNENIPNTITTVIFDETSSLTEIGANAFYDCESLTSIELPDSVTTIGERAFYQCDSLSSVVLSENLETIGSYAFSSCTKLTDITIPASVTTIGDHAFYSCSVLSSVTFEDGSQLTAIGDSAFTNCYLLSSITIPDTVTSIGSSAFSACYALGSITIPASVESIGASAFQQCSGLRSVTFEDDSKLTAIESSTFKGCTSLGSITIPDTVESIGSEAFSGCTALIEIALPDGLTEIGTKAFYNCSALEKIVIPDGVTVVEDYTFYGCTSLASVTISANVTNIGNYAFYNNTSLTGVILPDALTSIGNYAFYNADSLTEITIPAAVESIGEYAFYSSGLTSVTFEDTSDITIGSYAFARSTALAKINDETTLSGAKTLLGVTDTSVFYQTALTDETVEYTQTDQSIVITDTDEDGNLVTLTLNQTKNASGDVDSDYLTGEYAFTTVHLESKSADLSDETARIYIQFSDSDGVIYASDSSGTTTAWSVGETKTFITGDVTFYVTLHQVEGVDGFYYLEFDNLDAGSTMEFTFATYYPSPSSDGGNALIYAEIEATDESHTDGTPSQDSYEAHKITWTTEPDTYTVTKTGSNPSFNYNTTDGGQIYLTGLTFSVKINRSSSGTLGVDYVKSAAFTDTITLPEGLSWREGLTDAIAAGNWYVTSSKVVYVTIDGTDYELCTLSNTSITNLDLALDGSGNIVMTWTLSSSSNTSNISTTAMKITYGDDVVVYSSKEEITGDTVFTVNNQVDAEFAFWYEEDTQKSTATATAKATLGLGSLELTKTSSSDTYYLGSAYTYTITAENGQALPYSKMRYIGDTLSDWLYLEPDEMERLLNADHNLTITLSNATLYETVSNTVTTTDGGSATIDQQMEGTGTAYTGEEVTNGGVTTGTLVSSDTVKATGVTIVLSWDEANDRIKIDVTDGYDYSGTYSSVSEALSAIGYYVTNDVTYSLLWDLGEDYILYGNTEISYSYSASVKDSFMRLTGDVYWNLLQDYSSKTSSSVALTTADLNTAKAFSTDYTGPDDYLDSSTVTGTLYRDFDLTKGLSISRNGSTLSESETPTDGDVVTYTVSVRHEGSAAYSGLPLVDKMYAGQVLLVPVTYNTQLTGSGLDTITDNGVEYYLLNVNGTYENVYITSSTVADKVVVSDEGTMIYCYLNISGSGTTTVSYKAVIDAEAASGADFSLVNQVWLNDHETHRLFDETTTDGSVLTIEKTIVTDEGDTPAEDETATRTILQDGGTQVTYRLELANNGNQKIRVTGADIYDVLPVNVAGDAWTEADITVSIVTGSATVDETDLSGWTTAGSGGWSLTSVEPGTSGSEDADATQYYLVWDDGLTLTYTGTIYIYVTLTFPSDDAWDAYTSAYLAEDLVNVLHVFSMESQVSHGITVRTKASLYKGVLETGLASSNTSSTATCTASTDEDGLWYYTNDSAGKYGYVEYYVVLYNEGPVNLYLNTLEDVLPDGFTYDTSAKQPASTTALAVTDSSGNTMICKTFTVTATYSSSANKVSFDLSGGNLGYSDDYERYYLEPGEAAVFSYYVWTEIYSYTSDTETNTIAMPFYDYNGGGLELSDDVSADTVSWSTDYNRNDGEAELWTETEASDSGMTGEGESWLASSVTVYRGQIKPGIVKTTSSETAGSGETLTWSVKVTNDGESTMNKYYVYDVIQSPYYFTGQLTYTVYDSDGNATTFIIGTLSGSDGVCKITGYSSSTASSTATKTTTLSTSSTTVYAYVSGTSGSSRLKYPVFLYAWTDSDGNLVLRINFNSFTSSNSTTLERTNRAFSLPSGGYGVLSIKTTSSSSTNYNGLITNTAYVQPISQTFDEGYIGDGVEILATDGDKIVGSNHAVMDEASVSVSYGYTTISSKSVTELDDSGAATDNTATSTSKDQSITLEGTDSTFHYTLKVTNGSESMDELTILDNLPQEDDTMTLTSASRRSEFTVLLADPANFTVTVTLSDGSIYTLTEGQHYTIQYSTSENVGEDDLDSSAASASTNTWYDSIADIPAGETVRSFRIIFLFDDDGVDGYTEGDYIPTNATVSVNFNATIDGDTVSAGEIAYNSFGYSYSASSSDSILSASPRKVGVQVPTAPSLVKKLVESDGSTAATESEDMTFTLLIYEGDTAVSGSSESDLIAAMAGAGITEFTKATVTVKAGESVSDSVELLDLPVYEVTVNQGSYTAEKNGDTWEWTDDTKYTIVEIPDSDFDFASWNTTTTSDKYTFTYDSSTDLTLTCANKEKTWTFNVLKVSSASSDTKLSGAVFALYSTNQSDLISDSDYAALDGTLEELPEKKLEITSAVTGTTTTWYLYQIETTDSSGAASWSGLKDGQEYYLVELQSPDGYNLDFEPEVVSQASEGQTAVSLTVTNSPGVELPKTGGIGIYLYVLFGLLLCEGAAVMLFRRRKMI